MYGKIYYHMNQMAKAKEKYEIAYSLFHKGNFKNEKKLSILPALGAIYKA